MINANELLRHATMAYQQQTPEIWKRAGVSRAYYAAFHLAQEMASVSCGTLPRELKENAGNHERLIRRLQRCCRFPAIAAKLVEAGDALASARALRVDADYELQKTVGELEYKKALRYAREIDAYFKEVKDHISQQTVQA